jgi:MFS transporter, DHA2 family, metal-tetracycline-proton antiporter
LKPEKPHLPDNGSSHEPDAGYSAEFRGRIVPLICAIVFFSVLNGTMFNVAVPDIAADFFLSPAGVSWVMTGYIVVFALASALYGKLADLYPVRRLITIGLLLFNGGALLGLFVQWYPLLIAARVLQASGGGAIPAMGMIVATRYFPPQMRGRVLGALASTVAFAAGVGPVLGGFLAGAVHWRLLFLPSLLTLIAIPLFRRLLPREEPQPGRLDILGALLLGGTVGLLLLFVAEGIVWGLPLAALLLIILCRHLRRSRAPFIPLELFTNYPYLRVLLTAWLGVSTVFGMFFLVPLLLRHEYGLDTFHIGLVIFPGPMSAAILGNIGGRMADLRGSTVIVRAGLALLIGGHLMLASLSGAGVVPISLGLVVCYVGFAFIQSSLAKTVAATLPHGQTGIGMGVYNLTFFTSGAFGAALSAFMIELLPDLFTLSRVSDAYQGTFLLAAAGACAALILFWRAFPREPSSDFH